MRELKQVTPVWECVRNLSDPECNAHAL